MKFKAFATFFFFLCPLAFFAQNTRVDSIPFRLEKTLLIFRGTVNGITMDYAFDTGASVTVANSINCQQASLKTLGGKRDIKDSNQKVSRINNIKINDLTVGNYHVKDLKVVSTDMPYLYCANLMLLGQDVIKRFNWKIDFEKRMIYVSQALFPLTPEMIKWPLSHKSNRPFVEFNINGEVYKNCLIDLGFTGVFEVNSQVMAADTIALERQKANKADFFLVTNLGLNGLSNPEKVVKFILDSIKFGNTSFHNIPVAKTEDRDIKLGVQFFNLFFNLMILNHSSHAYYLSTSNKASQPPHPLDANVIIQAGKFVISDQNTSSNSTSPALDIGEEIKSVNGKSVDEFKDECEFILWKYHYAGDELILEKMDGTKIVVKRSSLQ
jgi:hypothetical protein